MKRNFINDTFKKTRGGYSRLYRIHCAKCGSHICDYQKDGPGILKRMYIDRMSDQSIKPLSKLICPSCSEVLGSSMIYKKENRNAYRLFEGSVTKKVVKLEH